MSLLEQSPQTTKVLSPGEKRLLHRRLVDEIFSRIQKYETHYESWLDVMEIPQYSEPSARMKRFRAWIKTLSQQSQIPSAWKLKQTQLEEDVLEIGKIYEAILVLAQDQEISREMMGKYLIDLLTDEEYRVHVDDQPLPSRAKLETEFDLVSDAFNDDPWQPHFLCGEVDENAGERIMRLKAFNRAISISEAISEMQKEGYRPATVKELVAFAGAYPDTQRLWPIIALGSFRLLMSGQEACQHVAVLYGDRKERFIHAEKTSTLWPPTKRFLMVRL